MRDVLAATTLQSFSEYQQGYAAGYLAGIRAAQAQNGANSYQSWIVDPRLGAQNPGSIPINGRAIGNTLPELDLVGMVPLLVEAAPAPILDLD